MNDVSAVPTVPSVEPVVSDHRLEFSGRRADFVRLVLRGAMLELVTVGFYRFWLATDMRRHLWSNTSVDGDAAEYTGQPKELLLGFLFALAILMPIYVAYFLIGIEAERWKELASIPLILFFYLFAQFALYRARRYRVTRTVWRGVRFGMGGSGLTYVLLFTLWTLLGLVTFGLAMPWRQAALERYKMANTSYGSLPGRFDGTGWALFKRVWPIWAATLIVLVGAVLSGMTAASIITTPAALVALPFCYAAYKAAEWRWWMSGVRLGEVRFESSLDMGALAGLYWKVIGWSALLLTAVVAWAAGVIALAVMWGGYDGEIIERIAAATQQLSTLIPVGIGYLIAALAAGAVMRIYLTRDLWARVVQSATVHNLAAAESTLGQDRLAGAIGEGFADSIDLGGF